MRARRKPDRVTGWSECFREAASGPAKIAEGCELRAAGEHARWTARVPRATAPVGALEIESDRVGFEGRLYVGWDAAEPPASVAHWPELEARARRAPGTWSVRAEPDFGVERWLEEAHLELLDLRKQSRATGLELVTSGGYVRLRLVDARPAPGLVDRALEAADRLTGRLLAAPGVESTGGRTK
jgi:hypothetical protein